MHYSENILPILIVTAGFTLASGVRAQTQEKMDTVLLPKSGKNCPEQTKLIIPKEGNWMEKLQEFQTCSEKLTIKVIGGDIVIVQSGNNKAKKGIFNSAQRSIEPMDTKK